MKILNKHDFMGYLFKLQTSNLLKILIISNGNRYS
ncbi:hypothetical protein SAMN04488023_11837 [Pedobacter rhizosphaerae]|uniref:Uncharacterized protein n=1 Tax=Pedobacter rhizosphaerae TaxID=390241 RepID=A0A1H9SI62_9SPHI|nr:hypothetical protein SAMN04488023_11837 [Pedobacter rhizosphaerae]